jgi:uncharacterized Zn finger protein (UPF0148 family)
MVRRGGLAMTEYYCPLCHTLLAWTDGTPYCTQCSKIDEEEFSGEMEHELPPPEGIRIDRAESDFAPKRGIQPPTFDI